MNNSIEHWSYSASVHFYKWICMKLNIYDQTTMEQMKSTMNFKKYIRCLLLPIPLRFPIVNVETIVYSRCVMDCYFVVGTIQRIPYKIVMKIVHQFADVSVWDKKRLKNRMRQFKCHFLKIPSTIVYKGISFHHIYPSHLSFTRTFFLSIDGAVMCTQNTRNLYTSNFSIGKSLRLD